MTSPTTTPSCLNCGAEMQEDYCHGFGQKASLSTPGIRDFLHEAVDEFLKLDGKILNTIKGSWPSPGRSQKTSLKVDASVRTSSPNWRSWSRCQALA